MEQKNVNRLLEVAYTGEIVGEIALKDYNKVALITEEEGTGTTLASAIMAAYLSSNPRGNIRPYLYSEEGLDGLVENLVDFEPSALFLLFPCEEEDSRMAFREVLKKLAENMFEADVFLHPGCVDSGELREALEDEGVGEYISQMPIFTYSIGEKEGFMLLKEIYYEEGMLEVESLEEYPLNYTFVKLLEESVSEGY